MSEGGLALATARTEAVLRDCLEAFPYVQLRVTGECMEPALHPGAVAFVARRRPRFGDVVLCRHPEGLRLHRLVWGPPVGSWRTQADRARLWDPPLVPDAVLGTVVHVEGAGPARRRWTALRALVRGLSTRVAHAFRPGGA